MLVAGSTYPHIVEPGLPFDLLPLLLLFHSSILLLLYKMQDRHNKVQAHYRAFIRACCFYSQEYNTPFAQHPGRMPLCTRFDRATQRICNSYFCLVLV
jgi:hypothetical protein